jgi:uncharacterized protein YggE
MKLNSRWVVKYKSGEQPRFEQVSSTSFRYLNEGVKATRREAKAWAVKAAKRRARSYLSDINYLMGSLQEIRDAEAKIKAMDASWQIVVRPTEQIVGPI